MASSPYVNLNCTTQTFRPSRRYPVRWLSCDTDYPLAQGFVPIPREDWEKAYRNGYQFCAVVEENRIVAWSAVWRYSDTAWEVAAVRTHPEYLRRGYGQTVVSSVTECILANDRLATCLTRADNKAMQATAMRVGFVVGPRPPHEPFVEKP